MKPFQMKRVSLPLVFFNIFSIKGIKWKKLRVVWEGIQNFKLQAFIWAGISLSTLSFAMLLLLWEPEQHCSVSPDLALKSQVDRCDGSCSGAISCLSTWEMGSYSQQSGNHFISPKDEKLSHKSQGEERRRLQKAMLGLPVSLWTSLLPVDSHVYKKVITLSTTELLQTKEKNSVRRRMATWENVSQTSKL